MKDAATSAEADAVPSTPIPIDESQLDDSSGEETPLSGNALPLVLPILPPVTPPAASAAEGVESSDTAVSSNAATSSLPVTPAPTSTPAATNTSAADGAALPEEVLQTLNALNTDAPAADGETPTRPLPDTSAAQHAAQDKGAQERLRSAHELALSPPQRPDKQPATQTPTADQSAVVATTVSRFNQGNSADMDAAARRRGLTSLAPVTGQSKAAENPGAVTDKGLVSLPAQANATAVNAAVLGVTPATAADQLLREFKFERGGESITSTSPTTAHSGGIQPPTTSAVADDAPVTQLQTPMQNRQEWANGLGERIVWMANNNQQNAQIRLNPAHLGPIDVQVFVTGDQTNVSFTAHHATTREALEAATPRLREMLASSGQPNVNVNINHQSAGERSAQNVPQESWQSYSGSQNADLKNDTGAADTTAISAPARSNRSLIDAYA